MQMQERYPRVDPELLKSLLKRLPRDGMGFRSPFMDLPGPPSREESLAGLRSFSRSPGHPASTATFQDLPGIWELPFRRSKTRFGQLSPGITPKLTAAGEVDPTVTLPTKVDAYVGSVPGPLPGSSTDELPTYSAQELLSFGQEGRIPPEAEASFRRELLDLASQSANLAGQIQTQQILLELNPSDKKALKEITRLQTEKSAIDSRRISKQATLDRSIGLAAERKSFLEVLLPRLMTARQDAAEYAQTAAIAERNRQQALEQDVATRQQAAALIPQLFPDLEIDESVLAGGINPALIPVLIQLAQFRFAQQQAGGQATAPPAMTFV